MTQKIIICILFLVTVSLGSTIARAGQLRVSGSAGMHIEKMDAPASNASHPNAPSSASTPADTHHGKAARTPQMEELPHIHRYHRERVKKRVHHGKLWFFARVLVVICHLSLLWIGYLHLTH